MKFSAFALLVSSTEAATALTTPALCIDATINTALGFWDSGETTITALGVASAALSCTTPLELVSGEEKTKSGKIEAVAAFAAKSLMEPHITAVAAADRDAFRTEMHTQLDLVGAAFGIGKMSCVWAAATGQCTSGNRVRLNGTWTAIALAYTGTAEYFVAQWTYCKLATASATCNPDGYAKAVTLATAMTAADYFSVKSTSEQTSWLELEDKANVLLALAAGIPAAETVGAKCDLPAAVGDAKAVRPGCGTGNCCMGHKKDATDEENSAELCQLETASAGMVITTVATAVANSNYIEVTAAVSESQDGKCIEGAMRGASAVVSVFAALYMMA